MRHECYLSIGSNLGHRKYYLNGAIKSLLENPHITVVNVSSYYETEPYGVPDQAKFLNAVVEIKTSLLPQELLGFIQEVEEKFARERKEKWGPRTLDIDILLYAERQICEPNLKIPHPYLEKRAFVLVPLAELKPELILPSGQGIRAALKGLQEDVQGIVNQGHGCFAGFV